LTTILVTINISTIDASYQIDSEPTPWITPIMYVCLCKGITDSQIKDAVFGGASSLREVRKQLGVMSQCGKCGIMTKQIVEETLTTATTQEQENLFYAVN